MNIKFSIGSMSALKLQALAAALETVGLRGVVPEARNVPSGVNAQPVGVEEISLGAHNRACDPAAKSTGSLSVGIESGIVYGASDANETDAGWSEVALVVIILPDGREFTRWTPSVRLPEEYVLRARALGFEKVTVGRVMADALGGDPNDPLATVSAGKIKRKDLLKEAVVAALGEVLATAKDLFGNAATTFDISIGGVDRKLPIREVAPGVRVALFNILGDWELTEAAGVALSTKMYRKDMWTRGANDLALVMPDGKATALLHVLGRITKLPTFVARKERKPYMGDAVRSVSYRSITTNREQSLFLSADDAASLKGKRVIIVDDVVSTGGSIDATKALMAEVGAEVVGVAAIFCEGKDRPDVCSLGLLPLF